MIDCWEKQIPLWRAVVLYEKVIGKMKKATNVLFGPKNP